MDDDYEDDRPWDGDTVDVEVRKKLVFNFKHLLASILHEESYISNKNS